MVEVAQNDLQTTIIRSQGVFVRYFDIIKCHVGGARGGTVRSLDGLSLHAILTRDKEHDHALVCLAADGEVVGEHALEMASQSGWYLMFRNTAYRTYIGDPLFGPVHSPVLAIRTQYGLAFETCDI